MSLPIALDAFGGDGCPEVEVEAAMAVARDGLDVTLVGDESKLHEALVRRFDLEPALRRRVNVQHAPDRITMDDAPGRAMRAKPESSMAVGFELVTSGRACALVSAGNSGAMLAGGLLKYKRIDGVDRPAIITTFPTLDGPCNLLDMGANIDCKPINFAQFAVMGAVYSRIVDGVERPRVAILSNGSEPTKGTPLTRQSHGVLESHPSDLFQYVGYLEGKGVFRGEADVVVTDGFTGNVVLKMVEGAVTAFARFLDNSARGAGGGAGVIPEPIRASFRQIRRHMDPDSYGGAPLLGVRQLAIIAHGGSSPAALANGVRRAREFVDRDLAPSLRDAIAAHAPMFAAAKAD